MLTPRIKNVVVDQKILSSYPVGAPRHKLKPLADIPAGQRVPADVAAGLSALHDTLTGMGVDFRVTELFRSIETQRAAHAKYTNWLGHGKPSPKSSAFNPATMKAAFVAEPGYSFHNAGRAIDIHLDMIKLPVSADRQLDRLWEIMKDHGFRPVIKAPTEGASESWHFDFMGDWGGVYGRTKDYAMTAMCACLDAGNGGYRRDDERALQAQLLRAGYDIGLVDGILGAKTQAALKASGHSTIETDYRKLFKLRTK